MLRIFRGQLYWEWGRYFFLEISWFFPVFFDNFCKIRHVFYPVHMTFNFCQMTRPIHGRDPTMTKIWIFWLKSRRITIFEQKVYLNFRPNGIFYFNLKFRYLQKLLFLKKLLFLSKNYFRPKFIILAKISIPKSFFFTKKFISDE